MTEAGYMEPMAILRKRGRELDTGIDNHKKALI